MFRHVALFLWQEGTTEEQQRTLMNALEELPDKIEGIRAYEFGADVAIGGNYDFAVVADFDDESGYLHYRDHEEHRALVERYVQPIAAERASVQFQMRS